METMKIWDAVSKTDPAHTKRAGVLSLSQMRAVERTRSRKALGGLAPATDELPRPQYSRGHDESLFRSDLCVVSVLLLLGGLLSSRRVRVDALLCCILNVFRQVFLSSGATLTPVPYVCIFASRERVFKDQRKVYLVQGESP